MSCLALTFFYDYLESHGTPRATIQEGLPYPPAYLDDRLNWIDYDTFRVIERRVAELFPDTPDLFYNIGLTFAATRGLGFIRVLVRGLFAPHQVYARFPTLVNRFLFPFVTITVERTSATAVRGRYVFAPAFPPSEPFLDTVRGILGGVPMLMGAPPGVVRMTRVSSHEAVFDIEIVQWTGVAHRARGWWSTVSAVTRARWRNLTDAAVELEDANRLLQEKVTALTEAKRQLDRKVRDLTVLNALARAATGELDARQILRSAATVISTGLDDTPVVLLIAEGDPSILVTVASCGLSPAQLREVRAACQPDTPAAARLTRGGGSVRLVGRGWAAIPMRSHERLVGGMLIAVAEDAHTDPALFESMASQLAVSVENAMSYRVITDLRDHLEIRVRERTAELEEARTRLEDTVVRLEQSDQAKASFFTNVSHELRTPLTLILGPLEDMEVQLAQGHVEELRRNLGLVRRNAASLLHLVNEILDFAKLDAGAMPMSMGDIELSGLVDDVVGTLRPLADRKGITLRAELPREALPIVGDRQLLRRVVVNLVANALKYGRWRDQVMVRVYGTGAEAHLEVADTGPGIPAEEHTRIFERFTRASQHSGGAVEGSGIGLAMARDIVRVHNGTIEVESAAGQGAVFRVRLPRGAASLAVAERHQRPVPGLTTAEAVDLDEDVPMVLSPDTTEAPASGRHRAEVLVVEDNLEMREFLVRILRREHNVRAVQDGREAQALVLRDMPDAVVSDVRMAHLDGIELCRRLKGNVATRSIPVILVSARHGSEAVLQGFSVGADDYVTKPFSPPELLARVNAQLRIRSLATTLMRMEKQYSLGVLSAGIAHEMLNPVNAVVNAVPPLRRTVDRLGTGDGDDLEHRRAHTLLDAVETSGRRMHHVVKGILAYTRQEATPRPQSSRLSDDIESVLEILRYRMTTVIVHREYAWDEPVVHFPEWLDQVIMNLVVNALDAMRDRSDAELWICTERLDDTVCIRVRDTGPGIPPELRERIFTPFFTTKPPGQGTGLGLAISREIVAMHRGTLELNVAVPSGAEFVVSLPFERGPVALEA